MSLNKKGAIDTALYHQPKSHKDYGAWAEKQIITHETVT